MTGSELTRQRRRIARRIRQIVALRRAVRAVAATEAADTTALADT
jgi:hypothetical protein